MTSPAPGTAHNFPPTAGDHIDELPDVMQINSIEDMRKGQEGYVDKYVQEAKDAAVMVGATWDSDAEGRAYREAIGDFEKEIRKRLDTAGIDPNDPLFDRYAEILRNYSWDRIDDLAWTARADDGSGSHLPSPKMQAVEDLRNEFSNPVSPSGMAVAVPAPRLLPIVPPSAGPAATGPVAGTTSVTVPIPPPLPAPASPAPGSAPAAPAPTAPDNVDSARAAFADVAARRQVGMNLYKRGDRQEKYDTAREEYQEALNKRIADELRDAISDGRIPDTDEGAKRAFVADKLIDGYKTLQAETKEAVGDSRMSGFIRMMTSGGKFARIAKGVGLGLAAGATGALLVTVTGGGAFIGGIATGLGISARLARGYASAEASAGRGVNGISPTDTFKNELLAKSGADKATSEDSIELIHEQLMRGMDKDTKGEYKKRRKSAITALGLVAVSASAIELLRMGYEHTSEWFNSHRRVVGDNVAQPGELPKANPNAPADEPGFGAPTNPETAPSTGPQTPSGRGNITSPDNPTTGGNTTGPEAAPGREYSESALTMSKGEGLYKTYNDLGIPQKDWAELLDKSGPELHNIRVDGEPLAYKMPNGEWGLNMTADGKFPEAGLNKIMDVHAEMNGASAVESSNITTALETAPAPTAVNPASVADVLNSGNSVIDASEVANNPTLVQISHVSKVYSPEMIGKELGVRPSEWNIVQTHIENRMNVSDGLYTKAFTMNPQGYLEFKTTTIPPDTMADMLNQLPSSARARFALAA